MTTKSQAPARGGGEGLLIHGFKDLSGEGGFNGGGNLTRKAPRMTSRKRPRHNAKKKSFAIIRCIKGSPPTSHERGVRQLMGIPKTNDHRARGGLPRAHALRQPVRPLGLRGGRGPRIGTQGNGTLGSLIDG